MDFERFESRVGVFSSVSCTRDTLRGPFEGTKMAHLVLSVIFSTSLFVFVVQIEPFSVSERGA